MTIVKECFRCKKRKHILSRRQFKKLREQYTNKRGQVNWKVLWANLEEHGAICTVCHGEGEIFYPHIGDY